MSSLTSALACIPEEASYFLKPHGDRTSQNKVDPVLIPRADILERIVFFLCDKKEEDSLKIAAISNENEKSGSRITSVLSNKMCKCRPIVCPLTALDSTKNDSTQQRLNMRRMSALNLPKQSC